MGEISDKATNLLRIALSNSDRLVRLINDILDLERAQSGREPLVFRPVQMADLVRQAMDGMQLMAEAAGVLLIHDKTQMEITADADRLLQVLTNLLSNAVKFSPPNSAVSIMLRPGSSGVTLSVIDQGRGIPVDKLEAIFGRFQQVDASDSRQKGGSGSGPCDLPRHRGRSTTAASGRSAIRFADRHSASFCHTIRRLRPRPRPRHRWIRRDRAWCCWPATTAHPGR